MIFCWIWIGLESDSRQIWVKYNLGWCYNVNRDIGAMIDEMFDGKSSKEGKSFHYRGRRARPSAEEAEAMRAAAREESIDYMDYNSTNVRSNPIPPISHRRYGPLYF